MNRRAFLAMISAGVAAAADPERLLWVPGRKLISIPKPELQNVATIYFGTAGGLTWHWQGHFKLPFNAAQIRLFTVGPSGERTLQKCWPKPQPQSRP